MAHNTLKTLTPTAIRGQWNESLVSASLPPKQAYSLRRVIEAYWPAPHQAHWETVRHWALVDGLITETQVAALTEFELPDDRSQPSLVEFALYGAHRHLTKKIPESGAAGRARRLLSYCYASMESEAVDAGILYLDVLGLRRVLVNWFQHTPPAAAEPDGEASALVHDLSSGSFEASEADARRVRPLLTGERGLGERQNRRPAHPRQPRSHQRSEQAQRERLHEQNRRRPQQLSAEQVEGNPQTLGVSEKAHRQGQRAVHAVDEPAAEKLAHLQKSAPLPVKFQVVARARQSISARSLPSNIEAALMTDGQIDWAMRELDTPLERVAVAMLLLGWPIHRIEAITIDDTTDPSNTSPRLDPQNGHLWYRIQTGGAATAQLDVTLALSPTLLAVVQDYKAKPFVGIGKTLDGRWQSRGRSQPGLTVTCQRLTRTGRRLLWGLSNGGWEVAALSGGADLGESVALTYRQIPAERLQDLYNRWCRHWRLAEADHAPAADPVGSTRALSLSQLAEIQHQLRNRAAIAGRYGNRPAAWCDALNATTAYLAAALALVAGLRSLGPETELALAGERLWVHEKSTRHRRESRTVPLPPELGDALQRWQQRCAQITATAPEVSATQGSGGLLPGWFSLTRTNQLQVRPFQLRDWAKLVAQVTDQKLATNAIRHTLATAAQQNMDYPTIHWVMGHHREQEAPVHPVANAPLSFTDLRTHQQALLKQIRFDPGITESVIARETRHG